jgi:tetratricopeptide (TPR) repeat protein
MIFIPYNQPTEILKPGKKPFNLPSSFVGSQLSAVLSFWLFSTSPVRRNYFNTALSHQCLVQRIRVIGFIANEFMLTQKAIGLLQKQKYREAVQVYDRVLEIHPEDEQAWSNKEGICLDELGDNDEALECLTKAIDFNPRYVFALSTKAAELATKGRLDEAAVLMDKVLEINPEFEDALVNRGKLLIGQDRHWE